MDGERSFMAFVRQEVSSAAVEIVADDETSGRLLLARDGVELAREQVDELQGLHARGRAQIDDLVGGLRVQPKNRQHADRLLPREGSDVELLLQKVVEILEVGVAAQRELGEVEMVGGLVRVETERPRRGQRLVLPNDVGEGGQQLVNLTTKCKKKK